MRRFDLRWRRSVANMSDSPNSPFNAADKDARGVQVDPELKFKYDSSDPAVGADLLAYYKSLLAAPPILVQRRGIAWAIVSRYRDCVEVLRDHKRFSSVNPNLPGTEDFDAFRGVPVMTFVDPPSIRGCGASPRRLWPCAASTTWSRAFGRSA